MDKKEEKKKEFLKGIDIFPKAMSFTNRPMTGEKYLLIKSNDGGNHRMSDKDTKNSGVESTLDMVASLENLPEGFLEDFKKAYATETTKEETVATETAEVTVEDVIKSDTVDPEIRELIKGLSSKLEGTVLRLDEATNRNEETEKKILKKSCDDTAEVLEYLPYEKTEISDFLYSLKSSDSEFAEGIQDILVKCNEVISKGITTEELGSDDATSDDDVSITDPEAFKSAAQEIIKANDSDVSIHRKITDAYKELRKSDPAAYLAYNDAVVNKEIEPIK